MPIGKKRVMLFHVQEEQIPQLCGYTVGGFFFSFMNETYPLVFSLPLM